MEIYKRQLIRQIGSAKLQIVCPHWEHFHTKYIQKFLWGKIFCQPQKYMLINYLTSQQKRTVVNCPNPAEISGLPLCGGRAHGGRAPPGPNKKGMHLVLLRCIFVACGKPVVTLLLKRLFYFKSILISMGRPPGWPCPLLWRS